MQQQSFEPLIFGYYKDTDGQMLPVATKVLPAPQAITEFVRCQCKPTAPHKNVLAEGITYDAQNSTCVTQNAQTMKRVTLEMVTVMTIMCND